MSRAVNTNLHSASRMGDWSGGPETLSLPALRPCQMSKQSLPIVFVDRLEILFPSISAHASPAFHASICVTLFRGHHQPFHIWALQICHDDVIKRVGVRSSLRRPSFFVKDPIYRRFHLLIEASKMDNWSGQRIKADCLPKVVSLSRHASSVMVSTLILRVRGPSCVSSAHGILGRRGR